MASIKSEKPAGTQLPVQGKKEAVKVSSSTPKAPPTKPAPKKSEQKPAPKKKASGGKTSAKMASLKSEKPVGTQLFGQVKKDPNKAADGATKAAPSKPGAKKSAPKVKEPKKKGKGGKAAAKH
ncbi:hypothetical protein ACOSQ2_018074 [Xanthoceras sorbifolium]